MSSSTHDLEVENCRTVFTKLDTNKDGKIDFDEFKKAFWNQGSNRGEKSIREAFDAADVNKNGTIDLEEMCKYLNKNKPNISSS